MSARFLNGPRTPCRPVPPTSNARRCAGVVGLGVWLLLALLPWSRAAALPAYLTAYTFILGLSVGSLGFLMLHHLVGGKWGFLLRRPLEAATAALPLMALLFLPLAVFSGTLYAWTDPEIVKESTILQQKSGYLNLGFWLVRAVIYFAIWNGLAFLMRRRSIAQDATEDPAPTRAKSSHFRPRTGRRVPRRHVRRDRLDDVDRAGMVFDDLRRHGHDRLGRERFGVHDRGRLASSRRCGRSPKSPTREAFTISATSCSPSRCFGLICRSPSISSSGWVTSRKTFLGT